MRIYDSMKVPITDSSLSDEGFLVTAKTPIARPGVFPYMTRDGLSYQAKLPDDLFSDTTIASANGKPVTNDHPNVAVSADNMKQLAVGMTMNDAAVKDNMLTVSMAVTDPETIKAVQAGKRELSIGFVADIDDVSGDYQGMHYDHVQRNMKINHVAIVDRGRAGSNVKINVDSADDDVGYLMDTDDIHIDPKGGQNGMEKLIVDGQTIDLTQDDAQEKVNAIVLGLKQPAQPVQDALDTITKLTAEKDTVTGERDSLKAQVAKLTADAADVEGKIAEKVKARVELEGVAHKILGDSADLAVTDRDIKIQVIKAVNDAVTITDSASDDYVDGAFNIALSASANDKSAGNVNVTGKQVTDSDDVDKELQEKRQARLHLNK
ncbi:MAG: DUF2213 domain-containing protein [Weissella confusa]